MVRLRASITKIEKQVLYRNYRSSGFTHEEAAKKVKDFCIKLKKIKEEFIFKNKINKMNKQQTKSLNDKFKEEFEKLCKDMEAERLDRK